MIIQLAHHNSSKEINVIVPQQRSNMHVVKYILLGEVLNPFSPHFCAVSTFFTKIMFLTLFQNCNTWDVCFLQGVIKRAGHRRDSKLPTSRHLSWLEDGANKTQVVGLIPAQAFQLKPGLNDPCGSLTTQKILGEVLQTVILHSKYFYASLLRQALFP